MSVFSGENNQNTEQVAQNETPSTSFVEVLAATKGDKWRDPEVIAKGKVDADKYIEELKTELESLREQAAKAPRVEDLLARLGEKAAEPTTAKPQANLGGTDSPNTKDKVSEEDIQSLIVKTLTEREREHTVSQNLNLVESKLQEMFGTEATKAVKEKAEALGLSVDRLKEVASESPNAFFALVGDKTKDEYAPFTRGSVRTEAIGTGPSNERNNAYYNKLRKENSRLFNSAETQNQMLADRKRLGQDFYN